MYRSPLWLLFAAFVIAALDPDLLAWIVAAVLLGWAVIGAVAWWLRDTVEPYNDDW